MKLITFVVAAASLASVARANWHLQLYRDESYTNIIEDRKGKWGQPCKNLGAGANDQATSMHWIVDGGGAAEIILYADKDCKNKLGSSVGTWNLPKFSSNADNKASSYDINYF
ncbi:hypothetical protein AAF712_012938 [Marasmius tenuissimus]|uniref:Uncharacterized protein n=1 Tax=Marasmius tenuissimus TaxID=585030 RepID=A0ABR2ZGD0_9AGAR|nr:hypothetical protein PM082_022890 [Marasmius tenuissimus]